MLVASAAFGADRGAPLVINHLCTDLAAIPNDAIQTAQDVCKWHYARLSHGRQLMVGFEHDRSRRSVLRGHMAEDGRFAPRRARHAVHLYRPRSRPTSYWRGSGIDITRSILNGTPALNISAMSLVHRAQHRLGELRSGLP